MRNRKIIGLIVVFTVLSMVSLAYAQTYSKITTFSDKSDQTTIDFSVTGSDLKFDWSYSTFMPMSAMLTISLYRQGDNLSIDSFMTIMGQSSGTNYEHNLQAGNYYLQISATDTGGGYTVIVSQATSATGTEPGYPALALLIGVTVIVSLAAVQIKRSKYAQTYSKIALEVRH